MSSLRNAVQRRNHKERAQPRERQKWGLLEKAKDYKLRAADHRVKKRKLKALQGKADERNEDEFYFAMVNSQSRGGVRVAQRGADNSGGGGKALSTDVVKLMKTQDAGYLRTVLQQTRREKGRAEKEVIVGDVGVPMDVSSNGARRIFADDVEEEPTQSRSRPTNDISADESEDGEEHDVEPTDRLQASRRKKLQVLEDRERDLSTALKELEHQRAQMAGTTGGTNKNGVKFRVRQRKR